MLAGDASVAPPVPVLLQQVTVCVEKDPGGEERVGGHLGLQVASEGARSRSAGSRLRQYREGGGATWTSLRVLLCHTHPLAFPLAGCAPRCCPLTHDAPCA